MGALDWRTVGPMTVTESIPPEQPRVLAALAGDALLDFGPTFAAVYPGRRDPCTEWSSTALRRASRTPEGPATLHAFVRRGCVWAQAFGPGAGWMITQAPRIVGLNDRPEDFRPACAKLRRLRGRVRGFRMAQTPTVLDALLPTILGQRVKVVEAHRSWRRIVQELGEPAPGPFGLFLPPDPRRLARAPGWWFSQHGVDGRRAAAVIEACRQAARLDRASAERLISLFKHLRGLGPWTLGNVRVRAFGDPDALIIGDYNLPHMVVHFFTGAARGTDAQMVKLLQPFKGQRARAVRWMKMSGQRAPRFGPKQRLRFAP